MRRVLTFIITGILLVCVFHISYAICSTGNFASLMIDPQNIENCALLNITWEKHLIDDDFDYAFGVHAADVDGDGDCDVLGAAQEGDFIAWWRNDGGDPISWTKCIIDDNFDGATSIYAVDIDGDGDVDVVGSAWEANEVAVWINEGDIPISWSKYSIRSGFHFAHEVFCHDVDGDGDMDIFATSSDDNQIAWWRNEGGDPLRWTEQIIGYNFLGAKSVRVADIDKDGLLDVVGATIYGDEIVWWRNCGGEPIVWQKYVIVDDFDGSHRAELYDMDGDGDVDVVGAAYFEGEISWWRNDGGTPISWTKQVIVSNFNGACIGLPVDIDDDGDVDVVGTAQRAYDVAVFRNDGGSPLTWTKIVIDSFFFGAWPGYVYDIDGDGDIDILAGASFGDILAWWESDLDQHPLKPERPSGPLSGSPGIEYSFETVSTDPYGKQLFYLWSWGDGTSDDWVGPYDSGEECRVSYNWSDKGSYEVKVKAKNIFGSESDWSDPLCVNIPKSKIKESPLYGILGKNPYVFPFLRYILNVKGGK